MYNEERKLIVKLIEENANLEERINSYREITDDQGEYICEMNDTIIALKKRLECAYRLGREDGIKGYQKINAEKNDAFELGKKCMKDFVIQECNRYINESNVTETNNYIDIGKTKAFKTIIYILEENK